LTELNNCQAIIMKYLPVVNIHNNEML
jgi:hypothetical protein